MNSPSVVRRRRNIPQPVNSASNRKEQALKQVLAQTEINEHVGEGLRKIGGERIHKFMGIIDANETVKNLFEVRVGDQSFTEMKLSPKLIESLYGTGLIDYASEIPSHKFHNVFELYYSLLSELGWFHQVMEALNEGKNMAFVTNLTDPKEIYDMSETLAFWFCYQLNQIVKKENIEIKSLVFENSVPIYSVLDYLARNAPDLLLKRNGVEYGGVYESCKIETTWTGRKLKLVTSHLVKYSRDSTFKVTKVVLSIPLKSSMVKAEDLGFKEISGDKKEALIERGKRYIEFASTPSYLNYSGEGLRDMGWYGIRRFNCSGRVMVDYLSMVKSDSNYSGYFGQDRYGDTDESTINSLDEELLFSACPFVYGYSMTAKQWVEMNVDNLTPIKFNDEAFDMLVLDDNIKSLVMSLVSADKINFKDIIESKGLGYIFLLSGGPGTGKTLLAEALAETLHKPIYYLSVGELGVDVDSLESRLKDVLEICEGWDAILLIDEIDIFVQKRGPDASIDKNAMTGVFLRLLEYYSGIMFLTTNLAQNLDPAFISRTSLNINFGHHLTSDAREQVWRNLTRKLNIEKIDYKQLATYSLNGRRIKNCLKLLMTLSSYKGVPPTMIQLLEIIKLSQNDAESTGYIATSGS